MSSVIKEKFKTDMISTENGYAYMICVGFTLVFTICMAHANSFGLMFNDFLNNGSNSASVLTSVNGLTGVMIAVSSLLVNQGKRWFSLRQMAIFGSVCYTLCWFLNTFLTNVYQMFFTISILNGFGWGTIMSTGYAIFNSYFVRKRVMMMGICMSIAGMGSIVFPFLVEYLLNLYGYRGMMAVVGAITANCIVGTALFQPVEWHLIPRKSKQEKTKKMKSIQNHTNKRESNISIGKKQETNPLIKTTEESISNVIIDKQNRIIIEHDKNINTDEKIENKRNRHIWKTLTDELDLKLFKNFSYVNVTLAIGIGMLCDLQFYLLQPLLLFQYRFSQSQVTKCVSITSIADLISRMILGVLGHFFDIKSRHLCYAGLLCSTIGRFLFMCFDDFLGVALMTAFLGFFRGWLYVALPLLCAEILPIEKYTAAYGLAILCNAILNALMAPVLGLTKDITGSFVGTFYIIASLCIIVIALWTYEFFIMKKK